MKDPAVYLMASRRNGTLYVGVTSNLIQRVWQHREGVIEGFTRRYAVKTLVWFEQHERMEGAIAREKAIKKWNRRWKLELIEQTNPTWRDLWPDLIGEEPDAPGPPTHSSHDTPRHSRACGNPDPHDKPRHSRGRGNPESVSTEPPEMPLGSRLRGNDGGERS